MALTHRTSHAPLPTRVVSAAFLAAAFVAAVLILGAVLLRNDSNGAASGFPPVNLNGIPQSGNVLGSPSAKVTLIEYADPQCPACRLYTQMILPTVVNDYVRPGKIDTQFRGFPFIGPDSVKGYRFLLAAGEQGKLWNLGEAFYRYQGAENSGWLTDDLVRRLAGDIQGLNVDRLFVDAQRPNVVGAASSAAAEASAAGIQATPTLLVKIGDSTPYLIQVTSADEMRAALDDALAG